MTEAKTQVPDEGTPSSHPASGAPEKAAPDLAEENGAAAKVHAEDAEAKPPKAEEKDEKEEEKTPLLAKGNPLRRMRGGVTAGVGGLLAFVLMAHNGQLSFGVPLGVVFVLVATWGVMDLLGTFDDADGNVANRTTLDALIGPLAYAGLTFLGLCLSLWGGQSGMGPQIVWGGLVTATFLAFVAALFRIGQVLGPWAKDEAGEDRPLLKRHGFWVVAIGAFLYLPLMGNFSLWDPWETHYGEVAREILARDDWISLWWAQDGWFWSKPILNFWIQSLAMASLGTHYKSDEMLTGVGGHFAHPEWVVRAPNVLLTILAMYLIYKGCAKVFGRRAGMLGAFVLATMPDWYFLAHQTMTDMPFVAAITGAMGLLLVGLNTDAEQRTKVYEIGRGDWKVRLSGWHLAFGAILLCAIPQILYLLSRNLELVVHGNGPHGFRFHWDEFKSGSAGNCGLPGNEACNSSVAAAIPRSVGAHPTGIGNQLLRTFGAFEPFLQAILWSAVIGTLLYLNWGERRVRRLYYVGAWFLAAIATMGKGPAGFALPMICAFAYTCTTKKWSELLRFELLSGALIILGVALPWYVAMYVRHGSPFTDRLIFHDMFNRAFHHVHDTNEGDDTSFRFYIWQLGYALFPWTALAPLGLIWWARRSDASDKGRGDASVFLTMWFVFAFALFSFMGTKFHHYIFPAVPPVAMLIGVVLDDMIGPRLLARKGKLLVYLAGIGAGAALSVAGVARWFPGSIFGTKLMAEGASSGTLVPRNLPLGAALLAGGIGLIVAIIVSLRATPEEEEAAAEKAIENVKQEAALSPYRGGLKLEALDPDTERRVLHERLMIGGAVVAGALVLILVGRDLALKPDSGVGSEVGAIRLLQLFTYNYRRPWPDTLDFSAVLTGFAAVATLAAMALAVVKIRHHAVAIFTALACVWAVWGLDVYMAKTSPHWGQHEVIEAYYANRAGPDEPLVAYQMNWKGENFYTSNHVPAFVSSGANFTNWMKTQREKGVKVMYFVTEHSRTGGLRSEVGGKAYKEITDKALCNKFVLVRAEL
jgi:4-amino-4-deoxy-L-arabinose transferase-like glycosyltransferase